VPHTPATQNTCSRAGEPCSPDPVGSLTSSIPRVVRVAAAAHIVHVLPGSTSERTTDGVALVDQLLTALDQAASGALRLCQLALEAADLTDPVDEWVSCALEETADALPRLSLTANPPSLIEHAEEAARCVAVAIDHAHSDPPAAPRAITDALGHLLVICVFADTAYDRKDA
jgi:hypothetical protein